MICAKFHYSKVIDKVCEYKSLLYITNESINLCL